MSCLIDCSAFALLFVVAFQDFRHRHISWFLIPALIVVFTLKALNVISFLNLFQFFLINVGFILVQLLALTIYFSIKNKKWTGIVDSYIGLGDILFFVVICVAFSPVNFVVFYLGGLIFTTVVYGIYFLLNTNANKEIPLAGIFAILIMMYMLTNYFFPQLDFYNPVVSTLYF